MAANPVLLNDLRRSLFRRRPVLAVALAALCTLLLAVPMASMSVLSYGAERAINRFPELLLTVIAPVFAAGSFAKEHEIRTWQDLMMTRLTNGQILVGKLFAGLVPTCVLLLVVAPAFALLLIIQNTGWAMEPGYWMVVLAAKFVALAVFYLSVGLVCSFHSPNARTALAVTYCVVAAYAMLNYLVWYTLIIPTFYTETFHSSYTYYGHSSYASTFDPLDLSGGSRGSSAGFSLGALDVAVMLQSAFLSFCLLLYLFARLRSRPV